VVHQRHAQHGLACIAVGRGSEDIRNRHAGIQATGHTTLPRDKLASEGKLEEAARYERVRCYSLVHSYCTQLHVKGQADITVVQKARGHKDVRTTQICTVMAVDPRIAVAVKKAFARAS
jgi:site-specific recombinase XerD